MFRIAKQFVPIFIFLLPIDTTIFSNYVIFILYTLSLLAPNLLIKGKGLLIMCETEFAGYQRFSRYSQGH